jgi:hypothetical protein
VKHSSAEHHESNQESDQFRSIVDNLATIAQAVSGNPEDIFHPTMKKVEIPGLGLLHWQQFLEEVHVRVTERPEEGGLHGKEIDCLYLHTSDGWQFADSPGAFKISTARPTGGKHGFYTIVRRGDEFVQLGEYGNTLTPEEVADASELASNFANEAPKLLDS